MRRLKLAIKEWNEKTGGNEDKKIELIERKISELNGISSHRNLNGKEMEEIDRLNMELWDVIRFCELVWRKKSGMISLKEGDSNSAFFHKEVKFRAKKKMVHGLRFGFYWCKEPKLLKKKVFEYFSNYFSFPFRKWEVNMDLNFKRLSEDEASRLGLPFTMEEIKDVVWSCGESKAPRPDGFNMCFFKKCWQIVREDLFNMMMVSLDSVSLKKV
ncbi:hypothetical protein ES288_D10G108800v1 [Gossypium darwinii]|uniref:Uncharacterized protein n=2 Tax=Gossypium TaxID=3633 RepID=A0A5D2J472_GOSTO|nr:hypothetical protein ES288_D10G108800v1 [Gossypium darwinii]TYH49046.1 hypothetical protein ES332_D10G110000v1 [Gossypium tomentosum]